MNPPIVHTHHHSPADARTRSHWRQRLRAATIHLSVTLVVAALAAWLVFGLWYPYPYREISGGRELFLLVVAVDVVLGPLFDVRDLQPRQTGG